jgi:hypothetical protein
LDAYTVTTFQDLNLSKISTGVDQDLIRNRLAGQGSAAGAEREPQTVAIKDPKKLAHVRHGTGTDDSAGLEEVVRSVVGRRPTFEFRLHYRA